MGGACLRARICEGVTEDAQVLLTPLAKRVAMLEPYGFTPVGDRCMVESVLNPREVPGLLATDSRSGPAADPPSLAVRCVTY